MGERGARDEHAVGALERAQTASRTSVLVTVALVVHAPERKPVPARPEHGARVPILVAARQRRLALCREPAARVPPSGRRRRARIEREDREQLDGRAAPRPRRDRRAEREHAVVRVRRDDDDPLPAAGAGGSAATTPYDRALARRWPGRRRFVPQPFARGSALCAPATSTGGGDALRPRRPAPGDADRPELGLRARHADRPRLRRALRRRARRRHPRPRARDRGARLHVPLRKRRRAQSTS